MILVSATDLGRQYSGDPIFSGLRFEIRAGERIGLVGPNGAGKTTLMKLLAGEDQPEYGRLHVRPGVRVSLLRQQPDFGPDATLMDVAREGLGSLLDLQDEMEEAAREIAEAEDDSDRLRATKRYEQVSDRLEHQDAYAIDHRVEEVLGGLGFATSEFDRAARTFSGGQQSRMMLAKLLLESPDLMLLDEPSNHLDIATTEWLESYLSRQPVGMVVVSHDRYFLDKVVTKIWELHNGTIEAYPGNYSQYWRLRSEKARLLEKQAEKQQDQVEHLEAFIRRWGAGQKATLAKDREKKLARIERVEIMREIVGPVMGFGEVERSGDIVVEASEVSKSFDKPLFANFSATVLRGECVGVMGPNGAGKSTLMKILIGREKADSGTVKLGHKVQVGYYDQGLEALPPQTTVVKAVKPEDDLDWLDEDVRKLLGRFGLSGDVALHPVGMLSGGEKGKAALARLAATGANLLVMDEPTNHLDIWSCESLERSIQEFEGTVLVVSHDRYFLNAVADRLIVIREGRARTIEGDYEAYQRIAAQESAVQLAKVAAAAKPSDAPARSEKKKRKFPYRKADDLERDIAKAEAEVAELEAALADPNTWRDADRAKTTQALYDEKKQATARLYAHWEEAVEMNA